MIEKPADMAREAAPNVQIEQLPAHVQNRLFPDPAMTESAAEGMEPAAADLIFLV